jgi:hypothetical protein
LVAEFGIAAQLPERLDKTVAIVALHDERSILIGDHRRDVANVCSHDR